MEEERADVELEAGPWVPLVKASAQLGTRETALLLDSVGIPYSVQASGALLIPSEQAARAQAELEAYSLERRSWPPQRTSQLPRSDGVRGAATYAAILIAVHLIASFHFLGVDWLTRGRVDGEAMSGGGQWFRAVTALTLHGDLTHLVSNLVFGTAFGLLAAHRLGAGWAWSATLAAGLLGNLLNVLAMPTTHRSIGASTGVFGTLAVLMAFEWTARGRGGEPWLRRFAPPIAGLVLFGWLGVGETGSESRVDVSAHVFGLISGLGLGAVLGRFSPTERWGSAGDRCMAAIALSVLGASWVAALL